MKIELAEALWRLGELEARDVEAIATQALVDGFDSPALRELAWPHDDWWEIRELWEQALRDLRRTPMNEQEAALRMFVETARRTANGGLTPYDGAERLWRLGINYQLPFVWGDFLQLSEAYDICLGTSRETASINAEIVQEAKRLLQEVFERYPELDDSGGQTGAPPTR